MTLSQQIITIAVIALGTMATRFLPFIIFPEGRKVPSFITYLGKVLPCASIALLVIYCFKDSFSDGLVSFIPQAIAAVFIIILHKWKKNLLLSIGCGTVLYMVLVQYVFV